MDWTIVEGLPTLEADGYRFRVAKGDGRRFPFVPEEWSSGRWQGLLGSCATEAEAKAKCEDHVVHRRELKDLGRREVRPEGRLHTPWGPAQYGEAYGEGDQVVFWHTASHGGFKLKGAAARRVPAAMRREGSWYEEDCDWAIVVHALPELFTSVEHRQAKAILLNWMPHEYMAATGEKIDPTQSLALRKEAFARAHANDWVAIAASRRDGEPAMIEVTATRGGIRQEGVESRVFLVPSDEYVMGECGFVVDPARHAEPGSAPSPGP